MAQTFMMIMFLGWGGVDKMVSDNLNFVRHLDGTWHIMFEDKIEAFEVEAPAVFHRHHKFVMGMKVSQANHIRLTSSKQHSKLLFLVPNNWT